MTRSIALLTVFALSLLAVPKNSTKVLPMPTCSTRGEPACPYVQ